MESGDQALEVLVSVLLAVNRAGSGPVVGFATTAVVMLAIYASSRRSVVSIRAGAIELKSEVSGSNREVAEAFVRTVAAAAQWTMPALAAGQAPAQ